MAPHPHVQEPLVQADDLLAKGQFHEARTALEDLPDSPEKRDLEQRLAKAVNRSLREIMDRFRDTIAAGDFQTARSCIDQARFLAPRDTEVQAAAADLYEREVAHRRHKAWAEKRDHAVTLLDHGAKSLENVEQARQLLEELSTDPESGPQIGELLERANAERAQIKKMLGQLATLDEAKRFTDALRMVDQMIERQLTEITDSDGNTHDIYAYRGKLEGRAADVAEQKAGDKIEKARQCEKENPHLALTYIQKALELPYLPDKKIDQLQSIKDRLDLAIHERERVNDRMQEALRLMNEHNEFQRAAFILEEISVSHPHMEQATYYLERARGLEQRRLLDHLRQSVVRAQTDLRRAQLEQAKTGLQHVLEQLSTLEENEQATALHHRCNELLDEIYRREDVAEAVRNAAARLERLLASKDLDHAKTLLERLDREVRENPTIHDLEIQLVQQQGFHQNMELARHAFREGRLENAREQIAILSERWPGNGDVEALSQNVEAASQFQAGCEAFEAGRFQNARLAFERVCALNARHREEAASYLGRLTQLEGQEEEARALHEEIQLLDERGLLGQALARLESEPLKPSSYRDRLVRLKVDLHDRYRAQLVTRLETILANRDFEDAAEVLEQLTDLSGTEERNLVHRVRLEHAVFRAEQAAQSGDWTAAITHWEAARKLNHRDEHIANSLAHAHLRLAFEHAAVETDPERELHVLEPLFRAQKPNLELDRRLLELYFRTDKRHRAREIARMRQNAGGSLEAIAKTALALCRDLDEVEDMYAKGAIRAALERLQQAGRGHECFGEAVQQRYRDFQAEAVRRLASDIEDLEIRRESVVTLLAKYTELTRIDPDLQEPRERLGALLVRFDAHVQELIQRAVRLEREEPGLDELEDMAEQIRQALGQAKEAQKTKLMAQLHKIDQRINGLKMFEHKMKMVEGYLEEAKETGDDSAVDRLFAEAVQYVKYHHHRVQSMKRRIQQVREQRQKVHDSAAALATAFAEHDFAEVSRLVQELFNLDPNDDYHARRTVGRLRDRFANRTLKLAELGAWAEQRLANLEMLRAWHRQSAPDLDDLLGREAHLRKEQEQKRDHLALAKGLKDLADEAERRLLNLAEPPEPATSEPARALVDDIHHGRTLLEAHRKKWQSESDACLMHYERLEDLLARAGDAIDRRHLSEAGALVLQGLELDPFNKHLLYYKRVIEHA
ncbi:hypothetical protein SCOR_05395 [Sulfidibacter corallicola]|uniref:Tetratricopeptide repeat protein n=1 Tax=Sulfidibacter corallicola TaxID=2818388 RepID=A0A8A4TRZ7_SULCO|nr:hypothetical protein [Sulfidibacter corallicola]QTD51791.1 hypothetical protein J3U87_04915 [Sulfidibacter corallicola]